MRFTSKQVAEIRRNIAKRHRDKKRASIWTFVFAALIIGFAGGVLVGSLFWGYYK